mgnify:CR=1 FL=1
MGNNITDIKQLLNDETDEKHFSFEVLPPLKGNGTASLFRNIDQLKEFNPSSYITSAKTDYWNASAYVVDLER